MYYFMFKPDSHTEKWGLSAIYFGSKTGTQLCRYKNNFVVCSKEFEQRKTEQVKVKL